MTQNDYLVATDWAVSSETGAPDSMNDVETERSDTTLADLMGRLAIGDELLWAPERLVPFEHWVGHIPFAFWLIKTLRPRLLVELGTHRGNSYCAFCQAIAALKLNCRAMAVDTWEGDIHMGHEEGLLDELRRYHDPRYDSFSTLLEGTFDNSRTYFEPNSIDLLHMDGTHTYEAVKQDFATWRDAISNQGIVLFHDIAVHRSDFGVWRLWEELSREYPSFEFRHSYGLGVLGVGSCLPKPIEELFGLGQQHADAARLRMLFESRGQLLVMRLRAEQASLASAHAEGEPQPPVDMKSGYENKIAELERARAEAQRVVDERGDRIAELERAHAEAQERAGKLPELERAQAEAKRVVDERGNRIAELDRLYSDARRLAAERAGKIAEFERALAEAQRVVNERGDKIREIAEKLKGTEVANSELTCAVADLTVRFGSVLSERDAIAAERERVRAERDAILASTLWQLTRPMRSAGRFVPPGVRRLIRGSIRVLWRTVRFKTLYKSSAAKSG